jgi:hypothetical protein
VLAGVIGTRQHYGERGVGFTPASSESTVLAGDISHPPAQMVIFVLAGGLCHRWTQPFENFEFFKWSQIEKLST